MSPPTEKGERPPKWLKVKCPRCGSHTLMQVNGAWVRWKRTRLSLSLREMGEKIGFSAMYISDVELGRRILRAENADRIEEMR